MKEAIGNKVIISFQTDHSKKKKFFLFLTKIFLIN